MKPTYYATDLDWNQSDIRIVMYDEEYPPMMSRPKHFLSNWKVKIQLTKLKAGLQNSWNPSRAPE